MQTPIPFTKQDKGGHPGVRGPSGFFHERFRLRSLPQLPRRFPATRGHEGPSVPPDLRRLEAGLHSPLRLL